MKSLLIVLDSVGVGHAADAADFGDEGASTLGHIFESQPSLELPTLHSLGLDQILAGAAGDPPPDGAPAAAYGWMREASAGKDTTTGHWEIAGAPVEEPFTVFEKFPPEIIDPIQEVTDIRFIGNYARSGTVILEELGAEHVATGHPILYTSADSVLQIAAHEEVVPLEKLYEICRCARVVCDPHRIGRIIARPFTGTEGAFQRTANRKDFSMVPPPTILNTLQDQGVEVISIGKIYDIFAGSGIDASHPTKSNAAGMRTIEKVWEDTEGQDAHVFVNLVDFDTLYGHRRDPAGYAAALHEFDTWLASFLPQLRHDDLLILTADHGNDPTWTGTDHTREMVPLIVKKSTAHGDGRCLGQRETFADIAATLAQFFSTPPWPVGTSFLP